MRRLSIQVGAIALAFLFIACADDTAGESSPLAQEQAEDSGPTEDTVSTSPVPLPDGGVSDSSEPDASESDAAEPDAAEPDAAIAKEWDITFLITDWMTNGPVEGVTLCSSSEGAPCVTTDTEGLATLTAVFIPGDLAQLRGDKEGYFPFLVEGLVPEDIEFSEEPVNWVMADNNIVQTLVGSLEAEVDDTKGHVSMFVTSTTPIGELIPLLDATVSMGGAGTAEPNYLNAFDDFASGMFAPEPGVTETSVVQFFNVEPGLATIQVDGKFTCVTGSSGVLQDDGSVGINVEAGRVSYTSLNCAPSLVNKSEGTFSFQITDSLTNAYLPGVTLCSSQEGSPCETTNAQGIASFTGSFTSGEIVELRGDASGYYPFYIESLMPDKIEFPEDPFLWYMLDNGLMVQLVEAMGGAPESGKGHVSVGVFTDGWGGLVPLEGPTVSLEGTVGLGPGYANPIGGSSNSLFAAEPGLTAQGVAGYFNVEPGRVAITVDGYDCFPLLSGVNNLEGATTINVEAARVSYASLYCQPKP